MVASVDGGAQGGSEECGKRCLVAMDTDKRNLYLLAAITFIGAILRGYNLGFRSLWLDEAATEALSKVSLVQIWQNMTAGEFNPPLFYVLEHYMMVFGNSEIILRILPAIFGALAIPVFYYVGKEFKDENTGFILATMCAFSPFLIWYSQEARAYSLLLLLIALATYIFIRCLKENYKEDWILFAAVGAVSVWVHFYALIAMGSFFVYAIWHLVNTKTKKGIVKNSMGFIDAVIIWFFLCLPIFSQMGTLWAKRTASAPTYGIQGVGLVYQTLIQLSWFSELVALVILVLFAIGIFTLKKHGVFLPMVLALVFTFSLVASFMFPMLPRYLIFLSVFLYLGVAISYQYISKITKQDPEKVAVCLALLFVLASIPFFIPYYTTDTQEDWRVITSDLTQITSPGDIVVIVPRYIEYPVKYYYSAEKDETILEGVMNVGELENITVKTTWYVITPDIFAADPSGGSLNWLRQNAITVKTYNGNVAILKRI